MKKIAYYILLAGLASVLIARAQTNSAAPSQPVDNTNAAATLPATNSVPEATPAPVGPDTNVAATVDATVTSNTVLAPESATNAPAAASANIPLIQFSDVPITTAIENLARQAGINYMLDPKIGYGQPDASGQIKAEPQLSIRWENISAESALLALLDNYGLQLVVDKKTSIDRIALKDPLAPPPLVTRVLQLQYASVSNMTEAVQSVFSDKRSKVIADNRTSQLLVVAPEPEQVAVDTLITQLDKQTKQVLIETKLIEISSNPTTKRGVDWSSTLTSQHVSFGNGNILADPGHSTTTIQSPGTPVTTTTVFDPTPPPPNLASHTVTVIPPYSQNTLLTLLQGGGGLSASTVSGLIPATAFLNADGLSAVISFLNASYDAQVVSTPRVVTLDNQTAHIEVVRTYPVLGSGVGSTLTYSNVGTILDVTPRISANDFIWLRVIPEVSSHFADQTITTTTPGGVGAVQTFTYTVPIFDRRRVDSQVMIPNGNTLVMGGLVQDSPTATYTKVPFLGDIPGLGWAFHSENKSMNKDNLIIFLTPTIIRDADFQPATTSFLQSKPKTMRSPMNPHKPWDGAEPVSGWSNPAPMQDEFNHSKPVK
jgi:type II secretory pathway component GspD/PulD (secretin)